jgi:hypothetical protein
MTNSSAQSRNACQVAVRVPADRDSARKADVPERVPLNLSISRRCAHQAWHLTSVRPRGGAGSLVRIPAARR